MATAWFAEAKRWPMAASGAGNFAELRTAALEYQLERARSLRTHLLRAVDALSEGEGAGEAGAS